MPFTITVTITVTITNAVVATARIVSGRVGAKPAQSETASVTYRSAVVTRTPNPAASRAPACSTPQVGECEQEAAA
ncbi:hypothetical protein EBF04_11370 [Streptomyces sp. I6]|nr:hypothetical protein EBF04_11370 [Streptomyces sp. I6]